MRTASIERTTKETDIRVAVGLDGTGAYDISTGIGFLDHMVEQFARHCGRKRDGHDEGREREAEILRRRFADRLGGDSPF